MIGTVFTWMLGLGVLFLSIYTTVGERGRTAPRASTCCSGRSSVSDLGQARLAAVDRRRRCASASWCIARPLLFASLDEAVAAARGVPVRALGVGFLVLVGVCAAEATQAVGALLLVGLLAAPAGRRAPARRTARGSGSRSSTAIAVGVDVARAGRELPARLDAAELLDHGRRDGRVRRDLRAASPRVQSRREPMTLGAALGVQQVGLRVVERRERPDDPLEQLIGEARDSARAPVRAGRCRRRVPYTAPSVVTPRSGVRGPERRRARAGVVTPRWFSKPTSQPVPSASSRTATSPTRRVGARVVAASSRPSPSTVAAVGADQRRADELEAGADREHDRARVDRGASARRTLRSASSAVNCGASSPPPSR